MKIVRYFYLHHSLETRYDYDTNCDEAGCDSICRCGRITNAEVVSSSVGINSFYIGEQYVTKSGQNRVKDVKMDKLSEVTRYCLDRLMKIHRTYDASLYQLQIVGGYYGEEIGGAYFDNSNALIADIQKCINMESERDQIFFVLEKEYSMILESLLEVKSVQVETVALKNLITNVDYLQRLKKDVGEYRFEEGLPVGVVLKTDQGYRLIDGYHRFSKLVAEKQTSAKYIVLE